MAETRQALALQHNSRHNTVTGVLGDAKNPFFHGPAARNQNVTKEEAAKLGMDDIKVAIALNRDSPTLHLLLIGDFEPDAALARASSLFGSAPLSPEHRPPPPLPLQFPAGQSRVSGVADPRPWR